MTRITPVVVVSAFVLLSACGSRSGAVVPVVATDAIHSRLNEERRVGTTSSSDFRLATTGGTTIRLSLFLRSFPKTQHGVEGRDFRSGIRQLASDPMRGFVTIEFDTEIATEETDAINSVLAASKNVSSTVRCGGPDATTVAR